MGQNRTVWDNWGQIGTIMDTLEIATVRLDATKSLKRPQEATRSNKRPQKATKTRDSRKQLATTSNENWRKGKRSAACVEVVRRYWYKGAGKINSL
jgi:hypothetical protein